MMNKTKYVVNQITKCLDIYAGDYKLSLSTAYLRSIVRELRTKRMVV